MDEDIATGKRIARQCKQMSIAAFVAALDVEFARGAYADRFDSDDGSTAMMRATITALLAYTSAGGTLELGHGWRIEQQKETGEIRGKGTSHILTSCFIHVSGVYCTR